MTDETCGVMTANGPCTMKKDHEARYHRHRIYDSLQWEIFVDKRRIDSGEGVNQLTTAISKNRVPGAKLHIEINC